MKFNKQAVILAAVKRAQEAQKEVEFVATPPVARVAVEPEPAPEPVEKPVSVVKPEKPTWFETDLIAPKIKPEPVVEEPELDTLTINVHVPEEAAEEIKAVKKKYKKYIKSEE